MRLIDLLENQRLTVQLVWGEQKIEFFSYVIEKDDIAVYVTPYLHNGSELELNITPDKNVICNLFTDNPANKKRISWKNVELTTVARNDKIMYCLKTNGYNHIAKHDDRRKHDRVVVSVVSRVFEEQSTDGVDIIVHDVSDIGLSFFAPKSFMPKGHQLVVSFSDTIGERAFDVKVECAITRMINKEENNFFGCKISKENKNYQLYVFVKHLEEKKKRDDKKN